jgi:hypothetical protein
VPLWWFFTAMRARSSRPAPKRAKYGAAHSANQPAGVSGSSRTPRMFTLGPETPRSLGLSKPTASTVSCAPEATAITAARSASVPVAQ